MLAHHQDNTIALPSHNTTQRSQILTSLDNFTVDEDLFAIARGPHVRDVEGAADAEILPEAGLADQSQGHGGAKVKERGCASAVEVAHAVAVVFLHGEAKGDGWVRASGV